MYVLMKIPTKITILDGAFATDGGSISLLISDPAGQSHNVLLTQHKLPPSGFPGERKPGRLYFNGSIIKIRSKEELAILSALKKAMIEIPPPKESRFNAIDTEQPGMVVGDDIVDYYAKIKEGPEAALRHLVSELISYVESEEYLTYAKSHDR